MEDVFLALRRAVRELKAIRERYARECASSGGGMDLFRVRAPGVGRPTENAAVILAKLSQDAQEQEDRVRELQLRANEILLRVRNPMSRRVILCRCYKAMSWTETAAAMGFADKRSALRAYRRAMDELK